MHDPMTQAARAALKLRKTEAVRFLAFHGCTVRTIFETLGCSRGYVRDRLREMGIDCPGYTAKPTAPRHWAALPGGRPHCMGHRFGAECECMFCGTSWEQHQVRPQECPGESVVEEPEKPTRATHCINGHEYTPENTYVRRDGTRNCVKCHSARSKRTYRAKKLRDSGEKPGATHCIHGHEHNQQDTYFRSDGGRDCRVCARTRWAYNKA